MGHGLIIVMPKVGRPSIYTKKLGKEILKLIAEGKSVRSISLAEDMPHQSTIFDWALHHPEFSLQTTGQI